MRRLALSTLTALAMLGAVPAFGDFHILHPPGNDQGEVEIEHNGAASFDRVPARSGQQSYTLEIGTDVTPWWGTEVAVAADRPPDMARPLLVDALATENRFRFAEPGEYWADAALYTEYAQSLTSGKHAGPNAFTFGPLFQKDLGRTTHTINLLLTRQLGPNQTTQGLAFSYAWQSRWNLHPLLSPAVEIYGDMGVLGSVRRLTQQQIVVGPVAVGAVALRSIGLGQAGRLKYEIGWLFGATQASPEGTLRWRFEVELPF